MMQFFAHGRDEFAAAALTAATRSLKMCQHLSAFDRDEHETWCEQILSERMSATVGEPEARGSYLKKHTTFAVTLESQQSRVRRRFSDFVWLHSVLRARYAGMLVPSLPDKTTVLKTDAYIQSRIRGLSLFLDAVLQSPYLRSDEAVVSFFAVGDEKEWEAAKRATAVMENAGPGHLRWLMRITAEPAPSDSEPRVAAFKKQLDGLERTLVDIAGCTKRMAEKSGALAKDVSALHTLFNGWRVEETAAVATAAAAVDPVDASFRDLLDKSTAAVREWSQVSRVEPVIYELLLHENVKYLLHQVKDMKELLAVREQALQPAAVTPQQQPQQQQQRRTSASEASDSISAALAAAQSAASVASNRLSAAASTASMFASRFRNAEASPDECESQQKRTRFLSDLVTRALACEEIDRFRKSKLAALSDVMSQLACAEAQLTKRSASMWREFVKASTADPQALAQSTQCILDRAAALAECTAASASPPPMSPTSADAF